jgi:hypothetical protein
MHVQIPIVLSIVVGALLIVTVVRRRWRHPYRVDLVPVSNQWLLEQKRQPES